MGRDELAELIDKGWSLERIARHFNRPPSTIAYWVVRHGLALAGREEHATRPALELAALRDLVEAGATIAEIAEAVDRSPGTVRRWLVRVGLRTRNAERRDRTVTAESQPEKASGGVRRVCRRHGEGEFVREGRGYYRCRRCRSEGVVRHRRKIKAELVALAGGRCVLCGYDRALRALEFHHLVPIP